MEQLNQSFTIRYSYNVQFTSSLFYQHNTLFHDFLSQTSVESERRKILFVLDGGVADKHPDLVKDIKAYFATYQAVQLIPDILVIPGGEKVKNNAKYLDEVLEAVNLYGIDRHSYIAAIGGGSVLDMVGYAAAISHRGVKHIRIPTTVLSQNDSGVGVKNGINYFNKKNFLGTFAPPAAVFIDDSFLKTLTDAEWRSGISEAVKVALIKDAPFFEWIEENASALVARNLKTMNFLIWKCAKLHMEHIAGKDPFETGSSRPLDFGHWSAHKLEYLTDFEVRHGEAVAMGIALDTVYSNISGLLSEDETRRILDLLLKLGFKITHPLLLVKENDSPILRGLEEFREHLGGQLTIMLLQSIGHGVEVHDLDNHLLAKSGEILQSYRPQ